MALVLTDYNSHYPVSDHDVISLAANPTAPISYPWLYWLWSNHDKPTFCVSGGCVGSYRYHCVISRLVSFWIVRSSSIVCRVVVYFVPKIRIRFYLSLLICLIWASSLNWILINFTSCWVGMLFYAKQVVVVISWAAIEVLINFGVARIVK